MNKVKIFKYLISFFLLLNFVTLIFGYYYFIDYSNVEKDWYQKQIVINNKKKELILKEINIVNNSILNISNNLVELENELEILKNTLNSKKNNYTSTNNLNSLTNELNLLNTKVDKLNQEKENLYLQYLRKQERKASRTKTTTKSS